MMQTNPPTSLIPTKPNLDESPMGRNKSNTNLLPKSERTHPTSKITTMSTTIQSIQPFQRNTRSTNRIPTLDDESLGKIFRYAGAPTMLRARSVCTQWRRVADEHLQSVRLIDLTRLFPAAPTSHMVRKTLSLFQHVQGVVIKNWPFMHVYPCIVEEIVLAYMPVLKDVELIGVYVTPAVISALAKRDSVRSLTIGGDDSIDTVVIKALTNAQNRSVESPSYLLDRLAIRRARRIDSSSVRNLSMDCVARELIITSCPNVKNVSLTCESIAMERSANLPEMYSITSCKNIEKAYIRMRTCRNDCSYLNLSQCTTLRGLIFSVEDRNIFAEETQLHSDIKELNLSGCRSLTTLDRVSAGHTHVTFSNLERLILFGVRSLRRSCIYSAFGLNVENIIMPKLQRLDLNGTTIDKLVLDGYSELNFVDVSGCPFLNIVRVHNCWKMQSFSILGKRAQLSSVHIVLPATCRFEGRRDDWHWMIRPSHQAITYPD